MRIDIVHQRKAEFLRLHGGGGRFDEGIVFETTDEGNEDLQEKRAQHFKAIGDIIRIVELSDAIADQSTQRIIADDAFVRLGKLLHDALQIGKIGGMVGLKGEKIIVERRILACDDLVKFRREGEIDIAFLDGNGNVIGVYRSAPS